MKSTSLQLLTTELLDQARASAAGRAAQTVHGDCDRRLRQMVIAFVAGTDLGEHVRSGEATLQVLAGRVLLVAGLTSWEGSTGDLIEVPGERHSLAALEDAAVMITAEIGS